MRLGLQVIQIGNLPFQCPQFLQSLQIVGHRGPAASGGDGGKTLVAPRFPRQGAGNRRLEVKPRLDLLGPRREPFPQTVGRGTQRIEGVDIRCQRRQFHQPFDVRRDLRLASTVDVRDQNGMNPPSPQPTHRPQRPLGDCPVGPQLAGIEPGDPGSVRRGQLVNDLAVTLQQVQALPEPLDHFVRIRGGHASE